MNRHYLLGIASVALLASCDKVEEIAREANSTLNHQLKQQIKAAKVSLTDPELQALVDQTDAGVVFRKDLPFPDRLTVECTRRREISARFFQTSELGRKTDSVKGTEQRIMRLERAGISVTYSLVDDSFALPAVENAKEGEKKIANPLQVVPPMKQPMRFLQSGNAWKYDSSNDFKGLFISQKLSPVFDELLIDHALAPRPLWFSKSRIPLGHQFDVAGSLLPMLVSGNSKGTLHLKLQSIEPIHGHPCGVFSVTGDYTRQSVPDFDGGLTDEDVAIQSGTLWLSLLYPVILKEELNTIQTLKPSDSNGPGGRCQGTIKLTVERKWKVAPTASKP